MSESERLFKVSEAIERLQISVSFFKRLRREGRLRVVKIGRRAIRVSSREIERFISREG